MAKSKKKQDLSVPRPVFWITGNYYDCTKKWKEILSEYSEPPNVDVHDCSYNSESTPLKLKSSGANEIILSLKQDDMFDDRPRIIRCLGCPQDYAKIYDYLQYVDDRTKLVIYGPIGYHSPAGSGLRFNSAKASNFYKTINQWGGIFEFIEDASKDSDAVKWIEKVSNDLGVKLEHDAAVLLVELKGRNLDLLYGEISKILDYDPKGKSITVDIIKKCCIPVFVKTTWDLIDCLDERNYDSAVVHMDKFLDIAGSEVGTSFGDETNNLLAVIRHHFDFLLLIRCSCGGRSDIKSVKNAIGDLKKPTKKDGKWTFDSPIYNDGYIYTNLNKPSVQKMLKQDIDVLYNIVRKIYRNMLFCRKNSSDRSKVRQSMLFLVMEICGRKS